MSWLDKLLGRPGGEREADPDVLWLYVQCDRCGARLAVRVDKRNEASSDYESGGYALRKEIMDSRCFQLMYAELRLDAQGNVVSRAIERGHFVTREEYDSRPAR